MLNPELAAHLLTFSEKVPLNQLDVQFVRDRMAQRMKLLPITPPAPLERVENIVAEGAAPVPLRIYYPDLPGSLPILVFVHGGGFVIGSVEVYDPFARQITHRTQAIVVSVEYRLAPEYKYPAGLEDVLTAIRWAYAHAAELGGDPDRIGLLGDSAGGNLATAAAMRLRSEPGARLAMQVLIYPLLDHYSRQTPSRKEFAEDYGLRLDSVVWFWDHYLAEGQDNADPMVSPLCSLDLFDLPETLIVTAECDLLRDEAEMYGVRLQDAGVPVTVRRYEGMIHGFMALIGMAAPIEAAFEETATWIRNRFKEVR